MYVAKLSVYFVNHVVPPPTVNVTASNDDQTVGTPYSLECKVIIAKGIAVTSSVDITWTVNGTKNRTVNHKVEDMKSQYTDVYNISELQYDHNNITYCCEVVINGIYTHAEENDSITIDNVTVGK